MGKITNEIQRCLIVTLIALLFGIGLYFLNQPVDGQVPTAASQRIFVKAHVSEILSDSAESDTWTEGLRLGTQEVLLTIDSGDHKGKTLYTVNYLNAYANIDLKVGSKIIVNLDYNDQSEPYVVYISSYDRSRALIFLGLVFVLLLVALGGKKGISAVMGLAFTIISIWYLLIPLLRRGYPAVPSTILLVAVTTIVAMVFLNGFSTKTMIATIGCIGGVSLAGCFAILTGQITPINGFNMMEAEELVLRAADDGLKISGLLVSGILISALGAVMDISLTITSAVAELHQMNPKADRKRLFRSGLNIGQDAMGTMANTLILAFAGASLNTLILFRVFDYPYLQIFNSDMITIEIIQGLAGSIGIVLTVPLVALLSAVAYGKGRAV